MPASLAWLLMVCVTLGASAQEPGAAEKPETADSQVEQGRRLALEGRNDEALENYRRAAELDPANALARVGLGEIHLAQGDLEPALGHFRAAVELDPTLERPRLAETQVLDKLGRYREALERMEEAHVALPTSGLAAYGLAWLLAASPDPALRDGERALELAERVYESKRSLPTAELVAEALAELDRCQKAAEWLRGIAESADLEGPEAEISARLERGIERFSQGPPCRAAAGPVASTTE